MSIHRALGLGAAARVVSIIANLISVIIVARLLTPEEIGIFSVSVSLLGFAHIFREFGITEYIIKTKDLDNDKIRVTSTIAILFAWLIAFVIFVGKGPMAEFYGHAGIEEVLSLVAVNFLILPFGTPILAMMRREMRFGQLAGTRIATTIAGAAVTVITAYFGQSYLSMAWGAIAMHVVRILIVNSLYPKRIFFIPKLKGARRILKFGSVTSLAAIIGEVGAAAPDLIFGKTLGFSEVAYFSRALGLRKMTSDEVSRLANSVYFPVVADNIRQGTDASTKYTEATAYMVAIIAPMLTTIAVLAEPLIVILFGHQWTRSADLASLICLYAVITTPYLLCNSTLIAAGYVRLNLIVQMCTQAMLLLVVLSSFWFTLEVVVAAMVAATLTQSGASQWALSKAIGLQPTEVLRSTAKSFILVPYSATPAYLTLISIEHSQMLILSLSLTLSVAGWLLGVRIMKHPIVYDINKLLSKTKWTKGWRL